MVDEPTPAVEPSAEPAPPSKTASPYVVAMPRRVWIWLPLLTAMLVAGGFTLVLFGEVNNWTSDPGTWARLPTPFWAILGLLVFVLISVYYILLLVRREVPERAYGLPAAPASAPPAAESEAAPETAAPAENPTQAPPHS